MQANHKPFLMTMEAIQQMTLGKKVESPTPPQANSSIAVVPIVGVMDRYGYYEGCNTTAAIAAIQQADADPSISGILLYVDSPGGTHDGTPELATAIKNASKPTIAYVGGMACSAALWAASQADAIYASESATVGSIGCYVVLVDATGAYEQMGFKLTLVSSGTLKGAGADGKTTQAEIDEEQKLVDSITTDFIAAVSDGRKRTTETVRAIADGRVFIGKEAMASGLVDGMSTIDAALKRIHDMNLAEFQAFAAANPDAVKQYVKQGEDQAMAALTAPAKVEDLRKAFPDDNGFVLDHLSSTLDQAKAAYAEIVKGKLTAEQEKTKALAAEVETLKAKVAELSSGQGAVAVALATDPKPADPDAALKAQGMTDTQIAAYRKAEKEGRIKVFAPAAKK